MTSSHDAPMTEGRRTERLGNAALAEFKRALPLVPEETVASVRADVRMATDAPGTEPPQP